MGGLKDVVPELILPLPESLHSIPIKIYVMFVIKLNLTFVNKMQIERS